MVIQRFAKSRLTLDRALPVLLSDSTSTRNCKRVERSFTPDAAAIVTDSRPSSLALTLVLAVSREKRAHRRFKQYFSVTRSFQLRTWWTHLLLYIAVHCTFDVLYRCCLESSSLTSFLYLKTAEEEHDNSRLSILWRSNF